MSLLGGGKNPARSAPVGPAAVSRPLRPRLSPIGPGVRHSCDMNQEALDTHVGRGIQLALSREPADNSTMRDKGLCALLSAQRAVIV